MVVINSMDQHSSSDTFVWKGRRRHSPLTRAGTRLAEVMALAEALPVRHSLTLAFPALRAQRPNRDAR